MFYTVVNMIVESDTGVWSVVSCSLCCQHLILQRQSLRDPQWGAMPPCKFMALHVLPPHCIWNADGMLQLCLLR